MELIRTFHPVGQGAFYTERFRFYGHPFNVIYDCGSTSLRKNDLINRIKSSFHQNEVIDLLFLSHFHADHINGIEYLAQHCKIKRVIIPVIEAEVRAMTIVSNLVKDNYFDTRLVNNPKDIFGDETVVIKIDIREIDISRNNIKSLLSEGDKSGIDNEKYININEINSDITLPSGTILQIYKNSKWCFIPYNYRQAEQSVRFQLQLKKVGLELKDINTTDKIILHKDKIRHAYKAIDGNLNANSMILLSGFKLKYNEGHIIPNFRLIQIKKSKTYIGCLYTGDINFKDQSLISDIKYALEDYLPSVGTIQIPHHGSIANFSTSIVGDSMGFAVVSYGTKNTYGHPSDRVISDVTSKQITPLHVTEDKSTIVTQSNLRYY